MKLLDTDIYVPMRAKSPIGTPGLPSTRSVLDGGLGPVPWEKLHPLLDRKILDEIRSYTLDVLKSCTSS